MHISYSLLKKKNTVSLGSIIKKPTRLGFHFSFKQINNKKQLFPVFLFYLNNLCTISIIKKQHMLTFLEATSSS